MRIAVIGAGPVGLSLALHAARALPHASVTIFDTRPAGVDPARDPRTLALSLGSIQLLQRQKAWLPESSQAITQVHVSQQAPALGRVGTSARARSLPDPCVRISARDEGVPQLGAVMSYGDIVAPLEDAWLSAAAREPQRLVSRFSTTVAELRNAFAAPGSGVQLVAARLGPDAGRGAASDNSDMAPGLGAGPVPETFDLAVVAEGGVFSDQARKGIVHDYRQTAWVGQVGLASTSTGVAYERFTASGPAALLPLPTLSARPASSQLRHPAGIGSAGASSPANRAALVWCVPSDADPVRDLTDPQRIELLNEVFHDDVGRVTDIGALKSFPLGLNAERTLTDGRIVRIGNAAQTLHPVAGQGLNLGMRDAFELVLRLSSAASIDTALRRIEWSRAPDRWAMIALTDFLARSFTWQLPGLAAARGLALAGLQMATPIKSLIARQMMFGRR